MTTAVIEQGPDSLDLMALRELRQARVMTQRELAEQAGISVKTLVDVEKFKVRPHPTTLRKLARALGVEPTMLAEHMEPRKAVPKPQPQLFPQGDAT
jgi:transcriptional regulator with XRE-family HTH domain